MVEYFRTFLRFSRNGKLILSYTLAKGLTLAIQGLVYNLYLLSLHFNWQLIGVLDAMPPVTVLVVSLPLGVLADRIGRKMLLVICTLVNPFSLLGMALSTSPTWQVIFGLANGVMSSFYWIAYPAIIVESSTEEDRQHLFSVNSMLMLGMGSLGYLLGGGITVLAGGMLHESPDAAGPLRWGLLAVFAMSLLGALPLLWLHEPPRDRRRRRQSHSYDRGLYARLLGPDALLSFGAGAVLSFNQLYFVNRFGLLAGSVGLFLAMAGVVGSIGALLSPALSRRLGTARAAVVLQGTSVPLIAALALAPVLGVALGVYSLWGIVRSAIDPTYTGFAMAQVPDNQRSTLSGLYSVTWAAGFGAGPLATGWLRGLTHGFSAPFLLAAACYGVASLALYAFFGRGRPAQGTPNTADQKDQAAAR
ncbi:MAG TPA: MFS transporter [Chloroflexota bacterium]|nr:MFS transporter [Chloroflexota bacterium]